MFIAWTVSDLRARNRKEITMNREARCVSSTVSCSVVDPDDVLSSLSSLTRKKRSQLADRRWSQQEACRKTKGDDENTGLSVLAWSIQCPEYGPGVPHFRCSRAMCAAGFIGASASWGFFAVDADERTFWGPAQQQPNIRKFFVFFFLLGLSLVYLFSLLPSIRSRSVQLL